MIDQDKYLYKVDTIVSYIAALSDVDQPLFWHSRDIGSPIYKLKIKLNDEIVDLEEWLSVQDKPIKDWLINEFSDFDLSSVINSYVDKKRHDASWNVIRKPDEGVVVSDTRRPGNSSWISSDLLRHKYWQNVISNDKVGLSRDTWARELHLILSSDFNQDKSHQVDSILKRVLTRRPNWEIDSSQSFRAWAYKDEAWSSVCDNWDCSYRVYQDRKPLALWSIDKSWSNGVLGALNEMNSSPMIIQSPQDIPSHWWRSTDEIPSGSLWHWACRIGDVHIVSSLLYNYPDILNEVDSLGRTGLHWAAANSNDDVAKLLSNQKGIKLDIEDSEGTIASLMVPESNDDLFDYLEERRIFLSNKEESERKKCST